MTTPEPTSADPHLIHDSSEDRSPYTNTNRDAILKSEPRTGKTMSGIRPPGSSYETGVTKYHGRKNSAPRVKVVRASIEVSAESASAAQQYFDENGLLTCESLEEFLTREGLDRLNLDPSILPHLWWAQLEPPITKASLSELDLEKFSTDPQLRHDVYIDRGVSFRPMVNGPTAKEKRQLADWYWDALVIEFALHITRRTLAVQRAGASKCMTSPWLRLTNPEWAPMRLPTMFRVIKEITKTLVPQLEWAMVDARLDVALLIQELEQGVCDVNGLIEWLGRLLLGSCSPMRDTLVEEMVSTVQEGVKTANARVIVNGLRDLFGILEIMKLDVANHQLRILRLLMVEDCIRFQQKVFLYRMAREPELREAHSWFRAPRGPDPENMFSWFHALDLVERRDEAVRSSVATFMNAGVDLIVSNSPNFPPTFEYDVQRLHRLQAEFQDCVRMVTYCVVFIKAIEYLGLVVSPTREVCDNLTRDLADLTDNLDAPVGSAAHFEAVTLEIVRQAHRYRGNDSLPSDSLLEEMERMLRQARNPQSIEFRQVQAILFNDLYCLVEEHVISTMHLKPWSIIDRLNPMPADPYAPEEYVDLPVVARRLAHILILHWRVWAPILYEQPLGRMLDPTFGEDSWFESGGGPGGGPGGGGIGGGLGGGEDLSWGGEERSMDIGPHTDAKGVM